jgi:hypothetical protein
LVIDPSAQVQRPPHIGFLGFGRTDSEPACLERTDIYVIIEIYRLLHKRRDVRFPLIPCGARFIPGLKARAFSTPAPLRCNTLIVPLQVDYYALSGYAHMLKTLELVERLLKRKPKQKILLTTHDARAKDSSKLAKN